MRLAASCLAWGPEEAAEAAALLRAHGAEGVELAPTALWGSWDVAWEAAMPTALAGFATPAMQSLLFGLPEHRLFAGAEAAARLEAHLLRLFALAARFGARALVFGAPRNRQRGALPLPEARREFAGFLARVCPAAAAAGLVLCLEANPAAFGCDFVTGTEELLALHAECARPGFGLHLDTGTAAANGEDLAALIRRMGPALDHVHVSEPGLAPLATPGPHHAAIGAALREVGYARWVSLEMLRGPRGLADLDQALGVLRAAYRA